MGFELFKGGRNSEKQFCSIFKSGVIRISATMARKSNFIHSDNVEIYYDKEKNVVGLNPVQQKTPYSRKIVKSSSGVYVSGISFLKYYNLTPKSTKRYPAEFDEKTGMIVFGVGL